MLILSGLVRIQGREPYLCGFIKIFKKAKKTNKSFDVLCLDICRLISVKADILIDTAELLMVIPVIPLGFIFLYISNKIKDFDVMVL